MFCEHIKPDEEINPVESWTNFVRHISVFEGIVGERTDRQCLHKRGEVRETDNYDPKEDRTKDSWFKCCLDFA